MKSIIEYINEVSVDNGLVNNPDKQAKEIAQFIKVSPEIINNLKKEVDLNYFIDYRCYGYEEHVIGYIGIKKNEQDKGTILGEITFDELKNVDNIVKKFIPLAQKAQ